MGLGVIALAALTMAIVRPATDTVTFQVIDSVTGEPLAASYAAVYGRWTALPIEKLRIGALYPWRTTMFPSDHGSFAMPGIPRRTSSMLVRLILSAQGHKPAAFTVEEDGYQVRYFGHAAVHIARTNRITIALERQEPRRVGRTNLIGSF